MAPLRTALLIAGAWTLIGFLGLMQYTAWEVKDEALVLEAVAANGLFAVAWALVTPFAQASASALFAARRAFTRIAAVLGLAATVIASYAVRLLLAGENPLQAVATDYAAAGAALMENVFPVVVIVLLVRNARMRRMNEQRRRDEAELSSTVARMQLQQLQAGLEPHFLFNALNSVAALIRDDPPAARLMLRQLSDLLERSLRLQERGEIPLREELAFARDYLEIQKMRFRDRLDFRFAVALELEAALVPPLILQPLIENAVLHGIARIDRSGVIEVHAAVHGGELMLIVRDSGPGFADLAPAPGTGIASVRARLALLYGNGERLEFRRDDRGFAAIVEVPYRGEAA
ncbi:MAG TPA: histidine kinase [Thermoanaerobaculia bacterium]